MNLWPCDKVKVGLVCRMGFRGILQLLFGLFYKFHELGAYWILILSSL